MLFRILDGFLIREMLNRGELAQLASLWEKAKIMSEQALSDLLDSVFVGPRPRCVYLVLDPDVAERDIGPIALSAEGVTPENGDVIYLLPRSSLSVGTIVHEYVHYAARRLYMRDIGNIAGGIAHELSVRTGVEVNIVDVEQSLRANFNMLDEALTYRAELDYVPRPGTARLYDQHVRLLATALARDLDLSTLPREIVVSVRQAVELYFARRLRPVLDMFIDRARLRASESYIDSLLYRLTRFAHYAVNEQSPQTAKSTLVRLLELLSCPR